MGCGNAGCLALEAHRGDFGDGDGIGQVWHVKWPLASHYRTQSSADDMVRSLGFGDLTKRLDPFGKSSSMEMMDVWPY